MSHPDKPYRSEAISPIAGQLIALTDFHLSISTLSNTFLGIDNREMKSESGFSFAIATQPLN